MFGVGLAFFSAQKPRNSIVEKFNSKEEHKNSGGAPVAKTGAPGEGTCTNCHAGSVMAGASQNILKVLDAGNEVTAYMPGVTYKVSLSLATGNVKEGFGATVLLTNNLAAGSFTGTGLVGTQVSVSAGKHYATHKIGSSDEGNVSWDWDWTAPNTESGPVTFYVASNKANGNNASSGDQIFVSQHIIESTLNTEDDTSNELQFNVVYSNENNSMTINFSALTSENIFVSLVDLAGKTILSRQLGNSTIGKNKAVIALNRSLKHGTYIVQFFIGNKANTKRIMF